MKTAKLKNGLICVSVPNKWERFYIDTVKSIGYFENNILGFFDPDILMLPHIQILGTITKDECSFDLALFCDDVKGCNCNDCFVYVKSMIEAENEFLFENNLKDPQEFGVFSVVDYGTEKEKRWLSHREKWLLRQSRVIEKLLILKTI
jgi:hypothetical protein